MIAKSLRRFGWRPSDAVMAVAMVALGVLATWTIWGEMLRSARFTGQSHILLVPFVCLYLVYVRRARFNRCCRTATWLGPLIIFASWLLMLVGPPLHVQCFVHLGAVLMVVGCLVSVVGKEVLLRFFPAFAVLLFFVPVPGIVRDTFAAPIHHLIAECTEYLFQFMGMNVDQTDGTLTINGYPVTVQQVSRGMIMVFTMILLSYGFAFGMPLRNYVRFLVIAVSPIAAIVLNAVRLILTVWLYGYAGPPLASLFHGVTGWLVVAVSFVTLCAIMRYLRRAMVPVTNFTLACD